MKQWIRRAALWAAALSLTATMAGCHTEPVTSAPETSGTAGSTSASGTAAEGTIGTASGTQTSESQPDGSSVTPSTAPTEPQIRDMQGRTFVFCAPSWDVIDTEEPYIRAIEETYNCHLENLQLADYGTLYSSILATDPLADIIVLNDSNFFSFVQKKLLCNWNAVSTAEPSNGELYIVQRNADFTVDGKLYGLMRDNFALQKVLVYNKSLIRGNDDLQTLASAGQLTWDKLKEILKKAKASGVEGLAGQMMESDILSTLIHANGGRVFSRDAGLGFTYTLESQNTRNAIRFAQELWAGGLIMSNDGGNYLYPQSQFAKGRVAMMIANSWNLNYIFERAKFDVGLVLLPGGPDVDGPLIEQTEFGCYAIPSTAKSPEDIGLIFSAWVRAEDQNGNGKNHFLEYWQDIIEDEQNLEVLRTFVREVEAGHSTVDFVNAVTSYYDDGLFGAENECLQGSMSAQSYLETVGSIYRSKAQDFHW